MKRLFFALIVLALIAGGAWYAGGLDSFGILPARSNNAQKTAQLLTAAVQRGDIEDLVGATGSLQPRDYVDVGAQVSGQLRKLLVDVGSEVKAGELLAEIDADTALARLEANRASLRAQQASKRVRENELVKAERDLKRQQSLLEQNAVTLEAVQNARIAVRTARAQLDALQAQIEQAEAGIKLEEANLRYTRIAAPMAGTVVSVNARQGQTINATQQVPTLLRIADLSVMTVQTQVSEADVGKLRPGMKVWFTTLGSPNRRWYSELLKIEPTPTVTNNVVLYNALFEVPNPRRTLMPQMTAQVFFIVAEARDVLTVPMAALTIQRPAPGSRPAPEGASGPRTAMRQDATPDTPRRGPGLGGPALRPARKATVRVLLADGSAQEREVTIGISNRIQAEVLEGLAEGERVVLNATTAAPQASGANRPPPMGLMTPGGARR